jgi:hypothetical protein
MNKGIPKYVTQARAAYLLGIPKEELGRLSEQGGIGRVERAGMQEERFFTYEELQRICVLAAYQGAATH